MKTYHKELGLPKAVSQLHGRGFHILYTRHALVAALDDRNGCVTDLPEFVLIRPEGIIEAEMDGERIHKIVYRQEYDNRRDLVLVLLIEGADDMRAKTVWTNLKTDKHSTLRKENYAKISNI